jgi:hypothetical protein
MSTRQTTTMTRPAFDEQTLDRDISTTLKAYLNGDIQQDDARHKLTKFFATPDTRDVHGDVTTHLRRILDAVHDQSMDINVARRDLINAALASQSGDAAFLTQLHPSHI